MKKIFQITFIFMMLGMVLTGCGDDEDATPCMDKVWYRDNDGDGKGDPLYFLYSCKVQPEGFVDNADDADDSASEI